MSAMMPFLPARMCVFPHSGFKKHDAIPDSASTVQSQRADAFASGTVVTITTVPIILGIDFSIQIGPRHFKMHYKPDNN